MGLKTEKIEHGFNKAKAGTHKSMKKDRNRKLRRTPKDEIPKVKKYKGWEF